MKWAMHGMERVPLQISVGFLLGSQELAMNEEVPLCLRVFEEGDVRDDDG